MRFVVFMDINRRWYWELRALSGEVIAKCPTGFADKSAALESIDSVRAKASRSAVFDPLGSSVER
ncbi:YegP family protein [Variovorax boronicumulans]|uniref:YegP family protein n=1 Tax=Variovorax boronicumulans TaxID=436515 RepID=UPI001C59DEDA